MTNIVIFLMFGGSWTKNGIDLALQFSTDPTLNLTVVSSYELKPKIDQITTKYNNLHFYGLEHHLNESYPLQKKHVIFEMYDIQKKFTTQYLRDDMSLINFLK